MVNVVQHATPLQLLSLVAIFGSRVIALPYGCEGTIEVLDVPSFGRYWACSGVEFYQGFNSRYLQGTSTQKNATDCANFCLEGWGPIGLQAGTWLPGDGTCECWSQNIPDNQPAASPGITYMDFLAAWTGQHPPAAQNWGLFTCPEGAASGPFGGLAQWCGPLNIEPAQPPLGQYGITGLCFSDCMQHPGFQWLLTDAEGTCNCYGDLAGVKVTLNYSSPYSVADYYDFLPHPTSSTTSTTKKTSTSSRSATSTSLKSTTKSSSSTKSSSKTSSRATTSSSSKVSSKSSSKSSSKTSSKSSSKSSSKTSSKTSSTTSSKTSSKSSSKTPSKTTSKTTTTSSSKMSTKPTTSSSKSSSKSPSKTTLVSSSKTTKPSSKTTTASPSK